VHVDVCMCMLMCACTWVCWKPRKKIPGYTRDFTIFLAM